MEGFTRNDKHTETFNMSLISRSAPTPSEKVIQEDVPFMQGSYDFSMLLGERIYENRPLSYTFIIPQKNYINRKSIQTKLENWLMRDGFKKLYDDHAKGYYYQAKCTSINTVDDYGHLRVDIEFEAYPFKISEYEEGNDVWDTFNFELDVVQSNEYEISGSQSITIDNIGSTGVSPVIIASNSFTILKNGVTYMINTGETKSESFRFEIGENELLITGDGMIKFIFYKELL